jgi:DNA repair exonuclease SbcCD ATPase subunit/DNA repair exonuclease SbcCD nuclease subunit
MTIKVAHISDIHYRGLSRHNEYRKAFKFFFKKCKDLKIDYIVITGDTFHTKTQGISPEVIDELTWFFESCSKICKTFIILGNHDLNLTNLDRQDALTPILNAIKSENLVLYKNSGVHSFKKGFNWCVFSCCDEKNWKNVKPVENEVNIALFHGCVVGSKTDNNWELEGDVDVSFFDDYHIAMLGDIHKAQFLTDDHRIAYPGSAIMQSYGEYGEKGFLLWEIEESGEFKVNFHEIPPVHPFVTIDWPGNIESMLLLVKNNLDGSRFRIRSDIPIPQHEIKVLCNELKNVKNAKEIVFKIDHVLETKMIINRDVLLNDDFRSIETHITLLDEYLKDEKLTNDDKQKLHDMVKNYVTSIISSEDVKRNTKWAIKKIEFDNVFSYGKGNVINFDKLNGITGIFGPNRSGKSSIVGTIMYGLFNTTDRGSISNLHIINSRKGHAKATVYVSIAGMDYKIERKTIRYENRKKQQSAITSLDLCLFNHATNKALDGGELNGLQRSDTDKNIRKLIGAPDDFLMTSLASQGSMNQFIKAGATQRKALLSKFLGLEIFEKMYDLAKSESDDVKAILKKMPEKPWDKLLSSLHKQIETLNLENSDFDQDLSKKRMQLQKLNIDLASFDESDIITQIDVDKQKKFITDEINKIHSIEDELELIRRSNDEYEEELDKIYEVKKVFPLADIKERYETLKQVEKSVVSLKYTHDKELHELNRQVKSTKNLEDIPCGDKFKSCKFIKDSYKDKSKISKQKERVDDYKNDLDEILVVLDSLGKENIKEKLNKYETLLQKESGLNQKISGNSSSILALEIKLERQQNLLSDAESILHNLEKSIVNVEPDSNIYDLKIEIKKLNDEINDVSAKRITGAHELGKIGSELEKIKNDYKKYKKLRKEWNVYEYFMSSVSKRGIPTQVLQSLSPIINSEIVNILHGVVNFTVEIEPDSDTNAINIYINYGDSKRIIELASGMEKMISSLAIRVALINISSLPKTDMLIIDEGFGALDESNIDACNRMLCSLKKWFKNIIVITHVDAVKDITDNLLEIVKNGKDSKITHT